MAAEKKWRPQMEERRKDQETRNDEVRPDATRRSFWTGYRPRPAAGDNQIEGKKVPAVKQVGARQQT
jgi:hypothetical protein